MSETNYLVLDFGGTAVKCAVMTAKAEMLEQFSVDSSAESYMQWLDSFAPRFERLNNQYTFKGIAISSCGAVDDESGFIHGSSALPYIHGINVKKLYQNKFGLPAEIENDACCAALAEAWLGEGQEAKTFCTFVIGTGVGGAIVHNKKVQKGSHLHGGEFGFTVAEFRDGRPVILGDVASTRALVEAAANVLKVEPTELNGLDVFRYYDEGNKQIIPIVENWFLSIATGIYNIQYSVDPELILIGGAVSKRNDFVSKINEQLDKMFLHLPISRVHPDVRATRFGNDANLIGALKHYLDRQGE